MMPPYSCAVPGRKPGTSTKVMIGISNASQKAHEARGLAAAVDVEHACQHHRLIGDDAHRAALDAAEADDDVRRVVRLNLEEIGFVDRFADQLVHIIRLVRARRDQRVEAWLHPVPRVLGRPLGGAQGGYSRAG